MVHGERRPAEPGGALPLLSSGLGWDLTISGPLLSLLRTPSAESPARLPAVPPGGSVGPWPPPQLEALLANLGPEGSSSGLAAMQGLEEMLVSLGHSLLHFNPTHRSEWALSVPASDSSERQCDASLPPALWPPSRSRSRGLPRCCLNYTFQQTGRGPEF